MAIVSGNNQTGNVSGPLAQPLVVRVEDAAAAAFAGATVRWTVIAGDGTVGSSSSTTDAEGRAQTSYLLGPVAGTHRIQAAVQNSSLQVVFTAIATSSPAGNAPAELLLVRGNGQSAPAGTALADSLVVMVRNAAGGTISGVGITWTVTAGGGTLGSDRVVTGPTGRSGTTYTVGAVGTNTIVATVETHPSLTVTFTATGT
jgi:hypothetical protein